MNNRFLKNNGKAILTVMVQADNPQRIKELMDKSAPDGAEAFGVQLEQLENIYRSKEIYKDIFTYAKDKPLYVTNYRTEKNIGKTDEELAEGILEAADCGADLCDIMGDYFDPQPDEITYDETAVEKQKALIDKLHDRGAGVLISTHIKKFISVDDILKIALSHQSRCADISKIVVGADNMEQQLENLFPLFSSAHYFLNSAGIRHLSIFPPRLSSIRKEKEMKPFPPSGAPQYTVSAFRNTKGTCRQT